MCEALLESPRLPTPLSGQLTLARGLATMSKLADCRKFSPNVFNKNKCSSCFKAKEEHSEEALENNRVSLFALLNSKPATIVQHLVPLRNHSGARSSCFATL